jgi:hypothetical protein
LQARSFLQQLFLQSSLFANGHGKRGYQARARACSPALVTPAMMNEIAPRRKQRSALIGCVRR